MANNMQKWDEQILVLVLLTKRTEYYVYVQFYGYWYMGARAPKNTYSTYLVSAAQKYLNKHYIITQFYPSRTTHTHGVIPHQLQLLSKANKKTEQTMSYDSGGRGISVSRPGNCLQAGRVLDDYFCVS